MMQNRRLVFDWIRTRPSSKVGNAPLQTDTHVAISEKTNPKSIFQDIDNFQIKQGVKRCCSDRGQRSNEHRLQTLLARLATVIPNHWVHITTRTLPQSFTRNVDKYIYVLIRLAQTNIKYVSTKLNTLVGWAACHTARTTKNGNVIIAI